MLRDGAPIGSINVTRATPGAFPDNQVALLQTFADQAVIAIENVRLFKALEARNRDLTETLEQQTATSEILRVISRSQTDVQPVFDTIVRSAVRLCNGLFSALYRFDGELLHLGAQHNYTPEALEAVHRLFPAPPTRGQGSGRAILERAVVHIPNVETDSEFQLHGLTRAIGMRSGLFVPMLRDGAPVGVIAVARAEPGPFSDTEIDLLKTFADQAVIAIENVRLFQELEARNRDLTVSLEQQTATAEVLRVIAGAQTDAQPVFDTIAANALRLCAAANCAVFRFDGKLIYVVALANVNPEGADSVRQAYPTPPGRGNAAARAILTRDVVDTPDVREDPEYQLQAMAAAVGFRSVVAVPMLREGTPIGVISVTAADVAAFSDNQKALLRTFADQALIAIENVSLFQELEARNRELRVSLEQQTATSDLLKVIGRSTFDLQPVFESLV
jgi:GAF domain-containing protein